MYLCLVNSKSLPKVGVKGADKYVHFIFHFVYVLFWVFYAIIENTKSRIVIIRNVFFSSFLFGILIEILQATFSTSRHADLNDVLLNTLGGFVAAMILKNRLNTNTTIKI